MTYYFPNQGASKIWFRPVMYTLDNLAGVLQAASAICTVLQAKRHSPGAQAIKLARSNEETAAMRTPCSQEQVPRQKGGPYFLSGIHLQCNSTVFDCETGETDTCR